MFEVKKFKGGVSFHIWVQSKASRNKLVGIKGTSLKIRVCAPPEGGKANKECLNYLAKMFGVSKSQVSIISGEKSRNKRIHIVGVSPSEVYQVIEPFLGKQL